MSQELILTFHGLGEPPETASDAERDVWVAVEWFEAIVGALPAEGVGLAFDDGNSSDIDHALGILREQGHSARFFVLAGKLDAEGYLKAEDVRELHAAGMRIGSHGLHHRDWRALPELQLKEELSVSRQVLGEIVGGEVAEAACPFGSYDRRVLRALRSTGYRRAYTSDGGSGRAGSWPMPRTTVHQGRPLEHWLDLASLRTSARPGRTAIGKRLVKRLR